MDKIGRYALFLGYWFPVAHPRTNLPTDPLWSISIEEQFYLFATWRLKHFNRKSLFGFCVAMMILSNV
jgi:peptidoglycan/LPS O-acetylase OafA/YrhL